MRDGFCARWGAQSRAAGVTVAGSELFPEALSFARARAPGATLYQMDARRVYRRCWCPGGEIEGNRATPTTPCEGTESGG